MAAFEVGAVLHWSGFEFEDGTSKDKFFVVLGAKQGHDFLVVITTSQPHVRSFNPGCHATEGYFHIPGGAKDFFPKDTWLLLMECRELRAAEVVKSSMDGSLRDVANLRTQLANEIRNCLKRTEDVSQAQLDMM